MKITPGALSVLVLSLTEAPAKRSLNSKRRTPFSGLQEEGLQKDWYNNGKEHYHKNTGWYNDKAKDQYEEGKNFYNKAKEPHKDNKDTFWQDQGMIQHRKGSLQGEQRQEQHQGQGPVLRGQGVDEHQSS